MLRLVKYPASLMIAMKATKNPCKNCPGFEIEDHAKLLRARFCATIEGEAKEPFNSQQIPIWVASTHLHFVEENVLFILKNIFQTKRRPRRIFPVAVFSFCLSHMFITHVVIDIFVLY